MNDFLPSARRHQAFAYSFELSSSIKDVIESLGVPHTEIEVILVNGVPVHFTHALIHGDRIAVYPPFETLNISPLLKLRPPIQRHHFVLDTHLGRLARYLRLLGFDSLYGQFAEDKDLARNSHEQQRILLTRDRGLLKRSEVVYGYYVRSTKVREQLNEIVDRFHLKAQVAPFSRCLECNTSLQSVAKDRILEQLQARTRQHFDEFLRCPSCNRIYWAGSHHKRMSEIVTSILSSE